MVNFFFLCGGGDFRDEGVFWGEDEVGGAEEGVWTGGEDGDGVAGEVEGDFCAFTTADPVALEGFDGFRPVEGFEVVDEALGVFGDAEHPLAEGATFYGFAFGFPFFDLFVGEDGAHGGGPVDGCFVDEGEADVIDLCLGPAFGLELGGGFGFLVVFAEV